MKSVRFITLAAFALLPLTPAEAADNYGFTPVTSGATSFIASREISPGVHAPRMIPSDAAGLPIFSSANPGYVNLTGTMALPTGASTAAAQATGNASLAAITTALGSPLQAGGNVGGYTSVATASFVRPANTTAYAAGQLVAASTTAGSVTALQFNAARVAGGSGLIRRARLTKSGTSLTSATFDLMLYRPTAGGTCPTSAAGDGAAFSTDSALMYLGRIPIAMDQAFTDGAKGFGTPATGSEIAFDSPAGLTTLCGLVRVTGAYTPLSGEVFTVALEILPN